MNDKRCVLVTGLPSHAARVLLLLMADREPESTFYALVPEHLLERMEAAAPVRPDNVHILTGDTVAMDLGLSGVEYNDLTENVTDIYHMASIFYLGISYRAARAVNVRGTLNVLQAASEMKQLDRLNHFSTAFVAGDRTGVILEEELDAGQRFRNAFERTKFEAEQVVHRWRDRLPVSIFRPSLIIGSSTDGHIDADRMEGPYTLMKAMLQAPADVPLPLPGKGDKPLNMVPIDWVCDSIHVLSRLAGAVGKTFHLTDPNPLPARRVFELVAEAAGRAAPRGRLPYRAARAVLNLPGIERVFRRERQFLDDFNQLALYNAIATTTLLHDNGHFCPPFPSYVDQIVGFLDGER